MNPILIALFATSAFAANHVVTVGQGGIVFNPNSITAPVGDTIEWVFTGVTFAMEFYLT